MKPVVRRSLNSVDGFQCVDILELAPERFTYQAFRREPEDPRGWRPLAPQCMTSFSSIDGATRAARRAYSWLAE